MKMRLTITRVQKNPIYNIAYICGTKQRKVNTKQPLYSKKHLENYGPKDKFKDFLL